ncbi:hypothetical protein [Demequina sediminicola]|uniref:hypothetical protein n=1 Tax=Demequina sediminicola TaxID=1095026 RepID=UPI00128D4C0B|nr:hypothetical protein [Demequina sediminicola]
MTLASDPGSALPPPAPPAPLYLPHYDLTQAVEAVAAARAALTSAATVEWVSVAADAYRAVLDSHDYDLTTLEARVLEAQDACTAAATVAGRYGQ